MKNTYKILASGLMLISSFTIAQETSTIEKIVREAQENSQLESLAQELLDGIGPRRSKLGSLNVCSVYLPPDYDSSSRSYPWRLCFNNQTYIFCFKACFKFA